MSKRKALNDERFSRQAKKIRNPLVRQAHFHNVRETGVDVTTTTTGRLSLPKRSELSVKPTPLEDVPSKQESADDRKQTQVSINYPSNENC
jgi:hypothetical protein